MPHHEIKRAEWDDFVVQLERAFDERIVAVTVSICDPHTVEVWTTPLHGGDEVR